MSRPIRARAGATAEKKPSGPRPPLPTDLPNSEEALRDFLDLLRALEEGGYLRFANDLLRSEDRVVRVIAERLDPALVRQAIRGLRIFATLGEIDRDLADRFSRRLSPALAEALRAEETPPVGVMEILKALNDPEVNRGVRMLLGFLRGLGRTPAS